MEILKYPDPFLLEPTKPVNIFSEELVVLLDGMYETMKSNNGIGLAANQVGLPYSMFVMDGPDGRLNVVNPAIVGHSEVAANISEGCLSAPGEFIVVPSRAKWVLISFQDEKGIVKVKNFKDVHAVCAQHEIDHLNGESFLLNKSLTKSKRKELAKKWGLK